jgi:hypothetical protein
MADRFDDFLAATLALEERDADRRFVARVQARIALDTQLRERGRASLRQFGVQVLGLGAIAAGLLWLSLSAPIAEFAAQSPAMALAGVIASFAMLIALFSSQAGSGEVAMLNAR